MFLKDIPPIILASGSPRRRQLLTESGFKVEFASIDCDESFPTELTSHEVACYLAKKKANAYTNPLGNKMLVTADTIVSLEGNIMNKPSDREEAIAMLSELSGKCHSVFTGVCIRTEKKEFVFAEETKVYFKDLAPDMISWYVDNEHPYDKAGSYGVQDLIGFLGVGRIEGCFYNVMGFPLAAFYEVLRNEILGEN
jgi:septum formation protein